MSHYQGILAKKCSNLFFSSFHFKKYLDCTEIFIKKNQIWVIIRIYTLPFWDSRCLKTGFVFQKVLNENIVVMVGDFFYIRFLLKKKVANTCNLKLTW